MKRGFVCVALVASVCAGSVLAKPPLRDVAGIDNALMAVAIADEIRKSCDGIDARMFRALATLQSLKTDARRRGYSDAEIEAYVTSKSEKERMREKAESWLIERGVVVADVTSLCAFGRAEIDRESSIGRLLR